MGKLITLLAVLCVFVFGLFGSMGLLLEVMKQVGN